MGHFRGPSGPSEEDGKWSKPWRMSTPHATNSSICAADQPSEKIFPGRKVSWCACNWRQRHKAWTDVTSWPRGLWEGGDGRTLAIILRFYYVRKLGVCYCGETRAYGHQLSYLSYRVFYVLRWVDFLCGTMVTGKIQRHASFLPSCSPVINVCNLRESCLSVLFPRKMIANENHSSPVFFLFKMYERGLFYL